MIHIYVVYIYSWFYSTCMYIFSMNVWCRLDSYLGIPLNNMTKHCVCDFEPNLIPCYFISALAWTMFGRLSNSLCLWFCPRQLLIWALDQIAHYLLIWVGEYFLGTQYDKRGQRCRVVWRSLADIIPEITDTQSQMHRDLTSSIYEGWLMMERGRDVEGEMKQNRDSDW